MTERALPRRLHGTSNRRIAMSFFDVSIDQPAPIDANETAFTVITGLINPPIITRAVFDRKLAERRREKKEMYISLCADFSDVLRLITRELFAAEGR